MWVALCFAFFAVALACNGKPNQYAPITDAPVLVSSVTNAKLFKVQTIQPNVLVAHIYGNNARERGEAYGTLLKPYLVNFTAAFFSWIEENIEEAVMKYVPKEVAKIISIYGLDAALDFQYILMKPYISKDFSDEVEGIAHASGLSYNYLMRLQMFPELVKAHCSIVGAWGDAVNNTWSDSLLQLRALDWATNSPMQQMPLVTVYHSWQSQRNSFAMLTWPGFLGALTGMSDSPVGVCEKVWLSYNGTTHRNGVPFTLLLRDILEFDNSVEQALSRMQSAKRTCSVWLGVGDPKSPERFRVISYSPDQLRFFNDSDLEVDNPQHPQLKDMVYVDKHVQPSHDPCLGSLLSSAWGKLDPVGLINVASTLQTGDTHAAIYDFKNMHMYVSNASPYVSGSPVIGAYDRPFVRLDMNDLFTLKQ